MTGAWAKACDAEALTTGAPLERAAWLISAVICDRATGHNRLEFYVVRAGAYVRSVRKSQPGQGTRVSNADVRESTEPADLLWSALRELVECHKWIDPARLRWAEACLRVWWHQQQRVAVP
jgi:hypothetical protein